MTYVSALAEAIEIVSAIEGKEELVEKLKVLKGVKEREAARPSKPSKKDKEKAEERERLAVKVMDLDFPVEGFRPCVIAEKMGTSTSFITRVLSALAEEGKLIREDKGKYKDEKGHSKTGIIYKKRA
jgi:hypothetical protein